MVGSVAGDLPKQVKNNQSVNMAAGNGGQKMSQYSWFTVYVKTGGNQQLVTTGVYRYIRNPAYAGTILSMLGNAFCFRSVFSPLIVILILAICYGIRIKVEEKALYECFGEEYKNYCFRSWRLIPLIW